MNVLGRRKESSGHLMVLAPTAGKEDINFSAVTSIFFITPLILGIRGKKNSAGWMFFCLVART
tara:strand:- start:1187 stop:1375 length:189 start_codon:yes stop_codon:yes gene_type:complete